MGVVATYALMGVIIGLVFGRVAGVFIAFLLPFPRPWHRPKSHASSRTRAMGKVLPGHGWTEVVFDTGLTAHFDQTGPLLAGLAWLGGLLIVATLVLAHGHVPVD